MFGVVPKTLWQKRAPGRRAQPDHAGDAAAARARRAARMLIDAGFGDKMDAKSADIYGFDRRENLDVTLARGRPRAEDIDLVLASHLHFDHAGGFTRA